MANDVSKPLKTWPALFKISRGCYIGKTFAEKNLALGGDTDVSLLDALMRQPLVYKAWMSPFAEKKFSMILAHNDLLRVRRVLDVGCGPGTNAWHFDGAEYRGIDINPKYIQSAEERYGVAKERKFFAVDAVKYRASVDERFDFILLNSFLHHVDDSQAKTILVNLRSLLTSDGHINIVDLVIPKSSNLAYCLARLDRGDYPRPLDAWRTMFEEVFEPVCFLPFDLDVGGICLWKLVYFKGKLKD